MGRRGPRVPRPHRAATADPRVVPSAPRVVSPLRRGAGARPRRGARAYSSSECSIEYTSPSAVLSRSARSRRSAIDAHAAAPPRSGARSRRASGRPSPSTRIGWCLPVPRSLADTLTTPSVSISNADLDLRHAARRGRDAAELEAARASGCRAAISRSPWTTWMRTTFWLSSVVENTWRRRVGIVVLRGMIGVEDPARRLDAERERRDVEQQHVLTSPSSTPAWIAAPTATISSGFTPLCGSLPKISCDLRWTAGMRVMPPTRITSSMSRGSRPASLSAGDTARRGARSGRRTSASSCARVSVRAEVLGPAASARDERQVDVGLCAEESSMLGALRRFRSRCSAIGRRAGRCRARRWKRVDQQVDEALVEVLAAEEGVAVRARAPRTRRPRSRGSRRRRCRRRGRTPRCVFGVGCQP